jgi:hypothetical protein
MTRINKLLIALVAIAATGLGSCTKQFDSINTNPDGLYPAQVDIDYQQLGAPLTQAQMSILNYIDYNYQVQQNLNADIFSGFMMSSTPFNGNVNNTNYGLVPGWNNQAWDLAYQDVMGPISTVLTATAGISADAPFYAWAKLLRVEAMHRISDIYGPIIYSHYGTTNSDGSVTYDSQQAAYTEFFSDLDSTITEFDAVLAAAPSLPAAFAQFDLVYGGNLQQWIKFANTLRLRLAIRVSLIDPTLAQTEGEKSLSDPNGLMSVGGAPGSGSDDAYVNIGSNESPLTLIAYSYDNINMGAPLLCYMNGYNDPRISQYAVQAADPAVAGQYIGIRQGINIDANGRYAGYSLPVKFPNYLLLMTAAEAWFLKAEAALRGWSGAGNAETDYNTGITTSMNQYGIGTAAAQAYITNTTNTEQPYIDPKSEVAGQNNVTGSPYLSTIPVAWNSSDPFQTMLQKIITQKWIAMYPEGEEAWAEFRRTLYPTLFPVVVNNSGGTISTTEFIRRLPFASDQYSTNAAGVNAAITLLGGPDNGGTPLWWDVNPH